MFDLFATHEKIREVREVRESRYIYSACFRAKRLTESAKVFLHQKAFMMSELELKEIGCKDAKSFAKTLECVGLELVDCDDFKDEKDLYKFLKDEGYLQKLGDCIKIVKHARHGKMCKNGWTGAKYVRKLDVFEWRTASRSPEK